MFANIDKESGFPDIEKQILEKWEKQDLLNKVLEARKDNPQFIFYEGPPTANGAPGIHHVMARSIKDAICRYKTMRGYYTRRKAGWDTHGLPVEIEVQKKLGIDGKKEIESYGIAPFNKACRESVFTYKDLWDQLTKEMGYWIDLDDPYITLDNDYIESVWWILSEFHKANLIYKGHRVVPYCPKCETPLSSHEVALGYKEVKDPSVYVMMQGVDCDYDFLVWTTTPWTLFSNVAIAAGKEIDYVIVKLKDRERPLLLAKNRLSVLEGEVEIIEELSGEQILGKKYIPLFPDVKVDGKAHIVIAGDFVSTEDGSGLVHIAPAFGDDDYRVSRSHGLAMVNPVDNRGCFNEEVPSLQGRFVKDADLDIIMRLKEEKKLYRSQKITHNYPHCWRCQKPLIYYAREAWFIEMTKLKDQLMAANETVNWVPATIGSGRFGSWLKNVQDWSLSRDRYWGTPLNLWVCQDNNCNHIHSIGSREELIEKCGADKDIDLHKPTVDDLVMDCEKCGGQMKRTPEVIDCWFDSGAMPFAQQHYPFENKDRFDELFPADFISEGIDQTRGWFYSLLAISVFLKGVSPYKNVVVGELVLDKEGQKMSKSRGNGVNPFDILKKYGADVTRWYLLTSTSVWLPTRFDEEGIGTVKRKLFDTLLNTYRFFVMYANVDQFTLNSERVPVKDRSEMDRWLIARMNTIVDDVITEMDNYDITKAMNIVSDFFVEEVSNWYVRLNRRRYWKEGDSHDKTAAYCTLQEVLIATCSLMAPVSPFITDHIYQQLSGEECIHLSHYPSPDPALADPNLEAKVALTRKIVELGRNLRTKHSLKVRQPLSEIIVQSQDEVFEELILAELNVKKYTAVGKNEELVKKKSKANFRKLGPIFGKKVPQVAKQLQNLSPAQISSIEAGEDIEITLDGVTQKVPAECVDILCDQMEGLVAESDGQTMVALKTELDKSLIAEGWSREFINRLQNLRKDNGLEITDRIDIKISGDQELLDAIELHKDSINFELLSAIQLTHPDKGASEYEIDSNKVLVSIQKRSDD